MLLLIFVLRLLVVTGALSLVVLAAHAQTLWGLLWPLTVASMLVVLLTPAPSRF